MKAKKELVDKDRSTVGFYRVLTPTILTIDPELIRLVFSTYFGSFPDRALVGESTGAGPIYNLILTSMPITRWRRVRSTLTEGFSTKNLNQMIPSILNCAGEFNSKSNA